MQPFIRLHALSPSSSVSPCPQPSLQKTLNNTFIFPCYISSTLGSISCLPILENEDISSWVLFFIIPPLLHLLSFSYTSAYTLLCLYTFTFYPGILAKFPIFCSQAHTTKFQPLNHIYIFMFTNGMLKLNLFFYQDSRSSRRRMYLELKLNGFSFFCILSIV